VNDTATRIVAPERAEQDAAESTIRPLTLDEFVGQKQLRDNLSVFIAAAKSRGEALDTLERTCWLYFFSGPPAWQDDARPRSCRAS